MSAVSNDRSFPFSPSLLSTVSKGISVNMMKISSKRRRTRKEIQDQKEAAAAKEADIQAKMNFFQAAEAKLA